MIKCLQLVLALLIISLVLVLLGWLGASIWGVALFGSVPVLPVVLSLLVAILAWVVLISVCAFFLNRGKTDGVQAGVAVKKDNP
ncbi:MAG: hypothetical protein ACTJHL_10395 [Neisseriaceae bacterium]